MKLCELTKSMIGQLKQSILADGQDVSYGELAAACDLVSDETVQERYGDTSFVPEDFTCVPHTVTTWVNPQTGLTLTAYGDPREDEDIDLVLSKDGKKLGEWVQNFTETDDSGEECDWSDYAPDSGLFLTDVIDCGVGDEEIPLDITDEEIYGLKPVKE